MIMTDFKTQEQQLQEDIKDYKKVRRILNLLGLTLLAGITAGGITLALGTSITAGLVGAGIVGVSFATVVMLNDELGLEYKYNKLSEIIQDKETRKTMRQRLYELSKIKASNPKEKKTLKELLRCSSVDRIAEAKEEHKIRRKRDKENQISNKLKRGAER